MASAPAWAREQVAFSGYKAGTVVIKTSERELYYTTSKTEALKYPVGVGRDGMRWSGTSHVAAKDRAPAWAAPGSKRIIPGGSPKNPMGAAALGLGHTGYGIHGTNDDASIGTFVSHGCIRMHNKDILDLYARVHIGTPVVVLP